MPRSNVPPSGSDRPHEGDNETDNAHQRLPLDDARQRIERLLRLYYRARDLNGEAAQHCERGEYMQAMTCAAKAVYFARESTEARDGDGDYALCDSYLWLARALNGQKRYEDALQWAKEAYELCNTVPLSLFSTQDAALVIHEILSASGRSEEAQEWLATARRLFVQSMREHLDPKLG